MASAVLLLCFAKPAVHLVEFAVSSELFSYIILIPFISLFIIWIQRDALPAPSTPDKRIALCFSLAGVVALGIYWATLISKTELSRENSLALTNLSLVLLFWGVCGQFLGRITLRKLAFPLGLLIFIVPFPEPLKNLMESGLQHASAIAAVAMIRLGGTPVFYHDLALQLPGITLEVAPECSGIHSSVALFVTSILAGYFFLRSGWKRGALALAVLPLGILRNGFRIFTIGELCVHIGPEMINSMIHRKGGPAFFALSLVPLLILLYFLVRSERRPLGPENYAS